MEILHLIPFLRFPFLFWSRGRGGVCDGRVINRD